MQFVMSIDSEIYLALETPSFTTWTNQKFSNDHSVLLLLLKT